LAALGVGGTATAWPDFIVAVVLATLFLQSARNILRQAPDERRMTQSAGLALRAEGLDGEMDRGKVPT
jgi:hypothetical protein